MKKENVWEMVNMPHLRYNEEKYFLGHKKKYEIVKRLIEETKPKKILDIGASAGYFYSMFEDLSRYEIHAVELVDEFVAILKKRGIQVSKLNIENENIPFDDGYFDFVVCDSIIEHTLRPKHLISEIARVLKSGGRFVIVVPNATAARRRWGHFRGRSIFESLIDSLYSKDYLYRCSVLYNERDLRWVTREYLTIDHVEFINEKQKDEKALSVMVCRLFSILNHSLKDILIASGVRK